MHSKYYASRKVEINIIWNKWSTLTWFAQQLHLLCIAHVYLSTVAKFNMKGM
jgi:hypothetical protein